jgi:hypothetical protein
MSLTTAVVQGVLRADGTLELDERPCLEPGRVQVILRAVVARPPTIRGLAGTIEEIRQYQQARGYAGLAAEEMAQHDRIRRKDEDEYAERMHEIRLRTRSGGPVGEP